MFVVFEGIDGSGKTTLSNLVARRLRARGLVVEHVREGGQFASSVTQAMRELGRDSRNLALTPRAELMLYLTREVQLLDEATRPALATADVVIADRFVATAEALAIYGRGLPPDEVRPLVRAAVAGLEPDLTILVDVEPRVARARRQVSKVVDGVRKLPSRKGLAGTALQHRLRDGYREIAARERATWFVVENTDAELEPTVEHLVELIATARASGVASARTLHPPPAAPRPPLARVDDASAALLAWIDHRAVREPGLAAHFVDGLTGPEFDARRSALAAQAPRVIAAGLKYLTDEVSWQLRRALVEVAPGQVARSIVGEALAHPDADAMLRSLVDRAPLDVASALWGRDDVLAWQLRDALRGEHLALSVGGVAGERASRLREEWLATVNLDDPRIAALAAGMVSGLEGERAWEIRATARAHAPVAAIESTFQLTDERAWRWRDRALERAQKAVIKSLGLLDHERAWQLRDRVVDRCEEVMDSVYGLGDERAWRLRERALDRWPPAAVKSLGPLGASERGRAMLATALARSPGDVALWRQLVLHAQGARAT